MTKKPQTIQETPNEEKEDDSIEANLRQHAREIANLKGQIAENDYKTETVQRQTAYLLHKNSQREEEEEETGMLATIFGWPKEATLEDRKLNARWLIDQSGVKDENMTMTFTDKKGRLSNYARLRFSNQGLRDRSNLPLSNSLSGKVGISDAKDEDGCLEPGARMRPVTSRYDSRKKTEENLKKMIFNVFKFYGYGPVKFSITSPLTISVSSVQLVKLLVAGTQQMG